MLTRPPFWTFPDGRSTIFWKIHGCDDLRSIFNRTVGKTAAFSVSLITVQSIGSGKNARNPADLAGFPMVLDLQFTPP